MSSQLEESICRLKAEKQLLERAIGELAKLLAIKKLRQTPSDGARQVKKQRGK